MDFTFGQTTSGVACHHRFKAALTVERRWTRHDLTALGRHARSEDVGRGMTSPPLDSTHGQTTSGVALYHRTWTTRTGRRRQAWHEITALGSTHDRQRRRGMTSPPFDSTHCRQCWAWHAITALGLDDTVGRPHAWYVTIALGRQTRSNNVGREMPSPHLDFTFGRTTSGVECHHHLKSAQTVE